MGKLTPKPCWKCGTSDDLYLMNYSPAKHVECFKCNIMGAGAGRQNDAIKLWNEDSGRAALEDET